MSLSDVTMLLTEDVEVSVGEDVAVRVAGVALNDLCVGLDHSTEHESVAAIFHRPSRILAL